MAYFSDALYDAAMGDNLWLLRALVHILVTWLRACPAGAELVDGDAIFDSISYALAICIAGNNAWVVEIFLDFFHSPEGSLFLEMHGGEIQNDEGFRGDIIHSMSLWADEAVHENHLNIWVANIINNHPIFIGRMIYSHGEWRHVFPTVPHAA
jgi:hypothetical protein